MNFIHSTIYLTFFFFLFTFASARLAHARRSTLLFKFNILNKHKALNWIQLKQFYFLSTVLLIVFIYSTKSVASATPAAEIFYNDLDSFKEKSFTLKSERQKLESSSTTLLSKKLFWTPSISTDLRQGKSSNNGIETNSAATLGAQINWNLFQGGKGYRDLESMKAKYKELELELFNESLQVEINAADLIFKNIYLQEMVRISEQIVKLKEESLKIAKNRFTQGKLPHHEMIKAEVDFTQQRSHLRNAKLDLFENKTQLQSMFIDTIKTTNWPFADTIKAKTPNTLNFPMLEQKYWSTKSYEAAWTSSKSLHFPSLDFNFQYDKGLSRDQNYNWLGQVSLTFPLWSRYESSAQISQSYLQYQMALNDQKASEQKLNQKYTFLQEKIEVTRDNLLEAQKNLQLTKELYKEVSKAFILGRISINDLFVEQNRLIESENSLSNNQLLFHQSLIEYCALTGLNAANCLSTSTK